MEKTSAPSQFVASDVHTTSGPPHAAAANSQHSTAAAPSAAGAAARTKTEHQLAFEQRCCERTRRRLVLKDSVHQVLKRYRQWAGNALRVHPTDCHYLIDLICEEGPARQRLQDDIVRQLGADPAEVRFEYLSSWPRAQLE